ncbi:hypothetical protein AXI59_07850 [Bacillus nakamurai]|uniref:hypothetical protein n=1 Tax=Bacillus nakamurai TaxID=1793963 RepID=UPI0007783DD4|nr:hypothetical protein [Bacillus nakamurai]KXZ23889.1 hypothetical protein AXI59_07850 [Bacillus nakamurai]
MKKEYRYPLMFTFSLLFLFLSRSIDSSLPFRISEMTGQWEEEIIKEEDGRTALLQRQKRSYQPGQEGHSYLARRNTYGGLFGRFVKVFVFFIPAARNRASRPYDHDRCKAAGSPDTFSHVVYII